MKPHPDTFGPGVRKLNPQLFNPMARNILDTTDAGSFPVVNESSAVQSKSELDGLNKTERRFYDLLTVRHPGEQIMIHPFTFRLGFDLRYTPDFARWQKTGEVSGILVLYEVKGAFEREDARVKRISAANKFPFHIWQLAVWKNGQWTETTIRP